MENSGKKYFFLSISCHLVFLLIFIFGFAMTAPLAVFENTNKNDVISAVVLGDTAKSKILPQQLTDNTPPPAAKVKTAAKQPEVSQINKDVIALQIAEKKKKLLAEQALAEKKRRDLLAKNLLAEIEKTNSKQKKIKQKQLQAQFQKTLQEQAEKSLREQLLNEEIKLKGTQSRQAQGEVNKYKALILQVISEHWLIPTQANKKLYCELMISVAPGGTVLDVRVTKSSGDLALDNSARAAVLKASPLPVPKDPAAFSAFRQFVLKVKPENILTNDIT